MVLKGLRRGWQFISFGRELAALMIRESRFEGFASYLAGLSRRCVRYVVVSGERVCWLRLGKVPP